MNVIKFKTKDFEMSISFDGNGIAGIEQNGTQLGQFDESNQQVYAAVIAMALHQYRTGSESEHDHETDIITLLPRTTDWNAKANVMNRLSK
ncbi:MAG: hypothetical protein RR386_02250 [Bacteroidaceae bacterium]